MVISGNFYEDDNKNEFLNSIANEKTRKTYRRLFVSSLELETKLKKDLFDFDTNEIIEFISKCLKPSTKESARTYGNMLGKYIQWGIDNKKSCHREHPLKGNLEGGNRQELLVNLTNNKKIYMSFDEKEDLLSMIVNMQDQFLIQALFEGIQGQALSELRHITISDIREAFNHIVYKDENIKNNMYKLRLTNVKKVKGVEVKTERFAIVSYKTLRLAELANKELEYDKMNGELEKNPYDKNGKEISTKTQLHQSKYVLKGSYTNPDGSDKMLSQFTLYNRLEMLKSLEDFEEFADVLVSKNITRSGMVYYGYLLYDRDGKIEEKHVREICEFYNIGYKWSLGEDFINEETIDELYRYELEDTGLKKLIESRLNTNNNNILQNILD